MLPVPAPGRQNLKCIPHIRHLDPAWSGLDAQAAVQGACISLSKHEEPCCNSPVGITSLLQVRDICTTSFDATVLCKPLPCSKIAAQTVTCSQKVCRSVLRQSQALYVRVCRDSLSLGRGADFLDPHCDLAVGPCYIRCAAATKGCALSLD